MKPKKKPAKFKDLTGNTYGRLTVIKRVPNVKGRVAFECKCSCGKVTEILAGSLRVGATKSCGCLHSELSGKDLTGQEFGLWKVLYVTSKRSSKGYRYWNCSCQCGKEKEVCAENLLAGKSHACGSCAKSRKMCINGHDTELWGRTTSNACKRCVRDRHLKTHYGISAEEFDTLFKLQKGKCAICKKDLGVYKTGEPGFGKGTRIEVDHDHKKKKRESVRGLLCGGRWAGCNRRLGRIDNVEWLENVVLYLKNPPAQQIIK
jgi:hypothetical protein